MVRFQRKDKSKGKKAAVWALLVLTGTATYFIGNGSVGKLIERYHPQIHKKMISVKPKILRTAHRTERNPLSEEEFTFFRVLNDAGMNEIVGLNGEVGAKMALARSRPANRKLQRANRKEFIAQHRKPAIKTAPTAVPVDKIPVSAPVPAPANDKALVVQAKPAEVAKPAKPVAIVPTTLAKFTVQVSSFKESRYAQALKASLEKKGYPAFTLKSELAGKNEFRHRVYIGRFQDRKSASRAASKIRESEKLGTLVVQHKG